MCSNTCVCVLEKYYKILTAFRGEKKVSPQSDEECLSESKEEKTGINKPC